MNIKRFVSADMREALRAIRTTLGPDAVMLSSRKVPEGVEVIAAIDYDDSLLAAVGDRETAAAPQSSRGAGGFHATIDDDLDDEAGAAVEAGDEPAIQPDKLGEYRQIAVEIERRAAVAVASPTPVERPVAAPAPQAPERSEGAVSAVSIAESKPLAGELKDLRRLLEVQLASLAWNDMNRRQPARAKVLRQFSRLGVDAALARELTEKMPPTADFREAWRGPLRLFAERLPLVNMELGEIGGTYAVVGPTGVGKTTTIAKMAARFILGHDVADLGLVSTDSYRIGAREQLLTFARILGVPMQVASNAEELRRVLDALGNKKLVLIDTAGMSQRDVRLANQFATLKVQGHRVSPVLTLSAATDRGSLNEAVAAFREAAPKALIITKLDEAASLGPVLSLALNTRLPIAYLSDGQRVPEDLHVAGRKRVWLMQTAIQLSREHALEHDEQDLAESYSPRGIAAHA
jgi:flagellar biosynthesis protein FlhF